MFNTSKLDQIIGDRQTQLEIQRQNLLEKTLTWLTKNAHNHGIDQAYIFGSVTQQGKFAEESDVDIAVENIKPESFCLVISLLMTELEREVDVIQLHKCHFANKIKTTGILWKTIN
jgi:predicted nucleotidyltransferase